MQIDMYVVKENNFTGYYINYGMGTHFRINEKMSWGEREFGHNLIFLS